MEVEILQSKGNGSKFVQHVFESQRKLSVRILVMSIYPPYSQESVEDTKLSATVQRFSRPASEDAKILLSG